MAKTSLGGLSTISAQQYGAFSRTQASEAGVSAKTLLAAVRRGELRRPFSDVFVFAAYPKSWRQRLTGLTLVGIASSHRSAGALHGLDGLSEGKLEVSILRGSGGRRLPGRVVRHVTAFLPPDDLTRVDGILCTTVERTLVDLGQVLSKGQLEAALDSALRGGLTEHGLRATLDRLERPGRTGVGPMRRLLDDPARSGAVPDSLFERLVERTLVASGVPRPELQHEIELPEGSRYRVDLAWPAARVAVEAHSKRWHFGQRQEADDNRRDLELAAAGWEVLYVTWAMAQAPDFFLEQLRTILEQRGLAVGSVG